MGGSVKHLMIQGLVQGVGFRYSMYYAAQQIGVTGWVRNRRDGSVEAVVQGNAEQIKSMIQWVEKGPAMAQVQGVVVTEGTGDFSEFKIEETI